MNGRNECHLCNATHYVAYIKTWIEDAILVLDQLCFAFYVQVEIQAQNRILHHEMSLSAIYNATSTSCILGVATGGAIACCAIVKPINVWLSFRRSRELRLTLWLRWSQTSAAVEPLGHAVCLLASYRDRSLHNRSVES